MKVLLVALNAKYIHTNLAVRYLKKSTTDILGEDIKIKEFTINNDASYIIREIYDCNPDILCFSCYIWNIDMISHIAKHIKKVMPETIIILGGPEVSFDTETFMEKNDAIDIVVIGEGEETFRELVLSLKNNGDYSLIQGIAFRVKGQIKFTAPRDIAPPMDSLPFPYEGEELEDNKILYYESSRGCPFNCQYCLSSTTSGVRFLSMERIKKELKYFIDQGVRQIKFVDRTFNTKKSHAMNIMNFISENYKEKINFHFEIVADLLDDELLEFLETVPVGLFQFEIGVQTTNKKTLEKIDRQMNFEKLGSMVRRISQGRNIHQHLDLIVGLPEEDYFSFRKSFDDVFELRPEKLQVGFLKLLKGSGLRNRASDYGYIYSDNPPYEIMETAWLSFGDISGLKGLEEMVETYWNSNIFTNGIEFIIRNFYSSSFRCFEELWKYWKDNGYHHMAHGKNRLYEILVEFYDSNQFDNLEMFKEVLKLDFLKGAKTSFLPSIFNRLSMDGFRDKNHKFLQKDENVEEYLPLYVGMPAKQIIKQVHFELFGVDVTKLDMVGYKIDKIKQEQTIVLFDYSVKSKALENCKYYKINLNE
ncbi:MAG: B12-binding domain-containing radical SAM protein [Candidatus Alkaliphilus sp. MAG34]